MNSHASPLALDNQLCFALHSTTLSMNKIYRQVLKPLAITYPQYLVMLVLWEQDRLTVSQLGERLFLDSATLTPLLKRMQSQQLLTRQRGDQDERQVFIMLTDKGQAMRQQAAEIPQLVGCATQCTPEQIQYLREQLVQLRQSLQAASL
ncbi:MarR family winged helix-turn-helix transcriptional regulator [Celerinatantimonas sp. YJH-8]|uniref:MarR family winged helix-turn-helix transcriptional regulator n=1 Tax=Celerinatantimonas sp. YJH-8 TaxID=3228714 RepID=UPI0038BF9C91